MSYAYSFVFHGNSLEISFRGRSELSLAVFLCHPPCLFVVFSSLGLLSVLFVCLGEAVVHIRGARIIGNILLEYTYCLPRVAGAKNLVAGEVHQRLRWRYRVTEF